MIKKNISRLRKSEYFGNLSVQLIGTLIAQLIPILISPILSRLYKKESFAVLALFMAIVGVLSVPNAGRYHIAIVKPEEDKEAESLYQISILSTFLYNILLLVLIIILYPFLNSYYALNNLWYIIPFAVFVFGIYNTGLFYSVRYKKFRKNAKAKIYQTVVTSLVSVLIVYTAFSFYGLVVGKVLGVLVSAIVLFRLFDLKVNFQELKQVANKYIEYPKLTIIPTLMNIFSLQALVLYVGMYFDDITLGYLALTNMILVAPSALIGMSYRDVFYQKITEIYNLKQFNKAKKFFLYSALGLFVIAFILCIILYFLGEFLFSFVYGNQWVLSGKYASILVFAAAIKLIVSPLSIVLNTTNKLKWLSSWQISYFITLNLTLYLSIIEMGLDVVSVFKIYILHEIVSYTIYFLLQYKSISTRKNEGYI